MDYSQFDWVFGPMNQFPYNRTVIVSIETSRRNLEGSLFIDRVLKAMNLGHVASNYPPKTEAALRQLHQHIADDKTLTLHHKLSIIYYLLLDIDGRSSDSRSQADVFAAQAAIPEQYQIFMKGLWLLDTRNFILALEHLTHPSLIPDFADDIITVLVRHAAKHHSSNTDGGGADYTLALAYYHTVQPSLRSPAALQALFDAVARASVVEAFEFARAHADTMRPQLFRRLIHVVLDPRPDEDVADRTFELASLPFDADEERWFRDYLEAGEGKRLKGAKDTIVMRRIATGRGALPADRPNWASILEGVKAGTGGRAQA
ncbi:nuclear pore complex assembly-domain-containing protein [Nemania sp. FL0916]|nr:nuclear pore complex assembly-domain-containing protein [Nemania sp. FL0916]